MKYSWQKMQAPFRRPSMVEALMISSSSEIPDPLFWSMAAGCQQKNKPLFGQQVSMMIFTTRLKDETLVPLKIHALKCAS